MKVSDDPLSHEEWRATLPSEGAIWLSSLGVPWWVAGGWALDLFIGQQTRSHKDLDIGLLRRDVLTVIAALPSWEFFEAKDGLLTRLKAGDSPRAEVNSLWCRPVKTRLWALELLLDWHDGESWVFRRQPTLQRSLSTIVKRGAGDIPYMAPEVQLLYKARPIREQDQSDFDSVAPRLDSDARAWLRNAIESIDPGHQWLSALDDITLFELRQTT